MAQVMSKESPYKGWSVVISTTDKLNPHKKEQLTEGGVFRSKMIANAVGRLLSISTRRFERHHWITESLLGEDKNKSPQHKTKTGFTYA